PQGGERLDVPAAHGVRELRVGRAHVGRCALGGRRAVGGRRVVRPRVRGRLGAPGRVPGQVVRVHARLSSRGAGSPAPRRMRRARDAVMTRRRPRVTDVTRAAVPARRRRPPHPRGRDGRRRERQAVPAYASAISSVTVSPSRSARAVTVTSPPGTSTSRVANAWEAFAAGATPANDFEPYGVVTVMS